MNLPKHSRGLFLTHNEYTQEHQEPGEWIANQDVFEWKDDAAKQRAIDTREVWTLQWYPDTTVGFYAVAAPTLDDLLELAACA